MHDSLNKNNRLNRLKIVLNSKWGILVFFLLLFSLTWRCASIQQPMGGPKESIPPKILGETPPNFTRNFTAEKIVIEFDEYVKLNNPQKEVSISPDVEQPINPRVKRKTIEVAMPDSL